jgi:hypothetical protein
VGIEKNALGVATVNEMQAAHAICAHIHMIFHESLAAAAAAVSLITIRAALRCSFTNEAAVHA